MRGANGFDCGRRPCHCSRMSASGHAAGAPPAVLPMRERARVLLENTRSRLDTVVPAAMREQGLDMWLVLCEEDSLDPVFETMIPFDTWCPILQVLVFVDRGASGVQRLNISGTDTADLFVRPYRGQVVEEQWKALARVVSDAGPRRIGINTGSVAWAASGLTASLRDRLAAELPAGFAGRLESAEPCAVRYLSTLTDAEIGRLEEAARVSRALIAECYSPEVLRPAETTIADLCWHYWQRVADLGLLVSFKPSFYLIRDPQARSRHGEGDTTIRPGDFVRCDVGLRYLRMTTDHQLWCYCARPGESDAPRAQQELMKEGNRLQDLFLDELRAGSSGNELLARMLERARREGIPGPRVYSHSLGLFLHEPGPLIGLPWEQQRCPGRGDVVARPGCGFAMELSVTTEIDGWGAFTLALEEDVVLGQNGARLIDTRQTQFIVL